MKNIVYFDHELNELLLVNEENDVNSIWIGIKTDANTNQKIVVSAKGGTTIFQIASSGDTLTEVPVSLWGLGNKTSFKLINDGFTSDDVDILFPDVLNTDSSLYRMTDEELVNLTYSMQGAFNEKQAIEDLEETIDGLLTKVLEYILPAATDNSTIEDGEENEVLIFKFNVATQDSAKISFYSCLNYLIRTSVNQAIYGDCTATIEYYLDGEKIETLTETYGDGLKIRTLNYLLQNLARGNHIFIIKFSMSGGGIMDQIGISSAYLLATASGGGYISNPVYIMEKGEIYYEYYREGFDFETYRTIEGWSNTDYSLNDPSIVLSYQSTYYVPLEQEIGTGFISESENWLSLVTWAMPMKRIVNKYTYLCMNYYFTYIFTGGNLHNVAGLVAVELKDNGDVKQQVTLQDGPYTSPSDADVQHTLRMDISALSYIDYVDIIYCDGTLVITDIWFE